jgi:hypothetical protein
MGAEDVLAVQARVAGRAVEAQRPPRAAAARQAVQRLDIRAAGAAAVSQAAVRRDKDPAEIRLAARQADLAMRGALLETLVAKAEHLAKVAAGLRQLEVQLGIRVAEVVVAVQEETRLAARRAELATQAPRAGAPPVKAGGVAAAVWPVVGAVELQAVAVVAAAVWPEVGAVELQAVVVTAAAVAVWPEVGAVELQAVVVEAAALAAGAAAVG